MERGSRRSRVGIAAKASLYHRAGNRRKFPRIFSRGCLHELGTNGSPNSDTTNLHRSDKGIGGLCVTSCNTSPAFQEKKTVFYQMAQLVEVFVVFTLFLAVLFWRDYGLHTCRNCIGQDVICVITPIRQQNFCGNTLNQVDSFFTICSGTFCNKDSDRHTIRIHGQMYFGVEPPFVLDMSWLPPFAPAP